MRDTLRTIILTSLGALDLTEEKLRTAFADLIKRGEMTEQEARELGAEWRERLGRRRKEVQQEAHEAVQRALRGLNVATRQDLDALAARVTALERQEDAGAVPEAEAVVDPEC